MPSTPPSASRHRAFAPAGRGAGAHVRFGILGAALALVVGCREREGRSAGEPLPAASTLPGAGAALASSRVATTGGSPRGGERIVRALGCGNCHTGVPAPTLAVAPPLGSAGAKHDAAYLYGYLRRPATTPASGGPRMPDYRLDEREALALALYLVGEHGGNGAPGPVASTEVNRAFAAAKRSSERVTAADGARIFLAQNCAACHSHPAVTAWKNAPDLSSEGARVRPEWLAAYLRAVTPVRPFGFYPGTGSRMPDFRLTPAEADSVQAFLSQQTVGRTPFTPRPLSAFAMHKAATLMRGRYPCLGCHQLDGEGGRIGPDLSQAGARLRPAFVRAMIDDPQHTVAGSVMPKTPMPEDGVELLASYLAQRTGAVRSKPELSLIDTRTHFPSTSREPASLYGRYCAQCHGVDGRGDGYNAQFLPTPPAAHADEGYMSRRADDTEFDGIYAGGAVLGRSVRMPAFGETLSRAEIAGLVRYIRRLCKCTGPPWGRTLER